MKGEMLQLNYNLKKNLFTFSSALAEDRFFSFNVYCISNHKLLYKHLIFKCLL